MNQYKELMQRTVACVSGAVLIAGGYHVSEVPLRLVMGAGGSVLLRGEEDLRLYLTQEYQVYRRGQTYQVSIVGYIYSVRTRDEAEILAYHWHAQGSSRVVEPHLHLGPGSAQLLASLPRAHLPTGPIGLAAVVRMLIEEFGIPPLREDWRELLAEVEAQTSFAGVPRG